MKKITKLILKIAGIVVLVLLLAAITLPYVFRNKIIAKVKAEINNSVNAKVEFKDFSLSLFRSFPNFSLGLEDLSVAGTGDFARDTLFQTKELDLTLDLMSVFRGNTYKVKKIRLLEPDILLKTLKDGKVNWDIAKESSDTATAAAEPSSFKMSIEKVTIEKGKLVYEDQSMNLNVGLDGIALKLNADLNGDLASMNTTTTVDALSFAYGGVTWINKARTELSSGIDADMKLFKFTFKDARVMLNRLGLGFDGWFAMPEDDISTDFVFKVKEGQFKDFLSLVPGSYTKDFDKVDVKGTLALEGFVKGVYNDNRIPGFAVKLKVGDAMFKYPDLPKAVTNINLDADISNPDGNPDRTVIDLRKLHLEMGNNPVDMKMLVKTPVSDPSINGNIKGKLDLAQVKDFYPLGDSTDLSGKIDADVTLNGKMSSIEQKNYEAFDAKGKVVIDQMKYKGKEVASEVLIKRMELLFSPKVVSLPVFDLVAGRTDVNATGQIDNFIGYFLKGEKLSGTFESRSRLIDLNEWMTGAPSTGSQAPDTTKMSVIEVPANLDLQVKVQADKILYDKMVMDKVQGKLRVADRKVNLEGLSMQMLGGSMAVSGTYSSSRQLPAADLNLEINGFDIPQSYQTFVTVQKLAPIASKCSGKVSAKLQLTTVLDEHMQPVYEKINGLGNLSGNNLEIKDFLPMNQLAEQLKIEKFKKLALDKVSMGIAIRDGKLEVKPNTFNIDKVKTTLSGWNALDQTISYDMVMDIPREMFGSQANAVVDNLVKKAQVKGVTINPGGSLVVAAHIGGTMLKPVITTDLKSSMASAVTEIKEQVVQQAKEQVQQEVAKVKEDLSAKAQQILAEAEKKAQLVRDEAKKGGELLISQAEKQGRDLVNKASNPIMKAAAKETSKQLVKQAKEKSDKLQKEADAKAQKILEDARKEAEKLK